MKIFFYGVSWIMNTFLFFIYLKVILMVLIKKFLINYFNKILTLFYENLKNCQNINFFFFILKFL